MACERKFNESEATTGFFLLLGQQGNKAVLDWVMKEGLIPSRYECPKCKKDMRLVERKGMIDGFEWRCRVQSKVNPHFVCRSVRKGTWSLTPLRKPRFILCFCVNTSVFSVPDAITETPFFRIFKEELRFLITS
ncbi:uncharacterized protein TNCV_2081831 [Trichonephila clavipes]|nr:uncharacterized protein TNCV_2081831 [Trichonephila clavipes]